MYPAAAALALTACEYDDSALWEQVNQNTERIAALEAWQAKTNTNIQALQDLLNTTDRITAVTTIIEKGVEVGYTISFLKSAPINIYHGKNGAAGSTPEIGLTQGDDGNWYWTVNGKTLTDDNGKPIQANGDSAPAPKLSIGSSLTTQGVAQDADGIDIVADAIYLSVDGGEKWTRVSGTDGTNGDSFFKDAPKLSDDGTYYTFTLADGTTFSVPRYTGIKLTFDTEAVHLGYGGTQPVNFTAEGSDQFTTDNLFIIAPDGWKAEVTLPTRAATKFILNVTAPADAASGAAEGEILVMLDNQQGNTTIGRIKVDCKDTYLVMHNVSAGGLATAIGNRTNLTSITVTSGTLNETDWAAVVKNKAALLYLDLAGATYEGTDKDNLAYSNNGVSSLPLLTIQLPQGVTGLGEYAFYNCTSLTSIDLPAGVTTTGEYTFYGCEALTSIDLPETLTSIGNFAFASCKALTSITLPDKVTSIGNSAFSNCTSLISIDLPEGVTSIGTYTFYNCIKLTTVTLPDKVTSIGDNAFASCTSLTSIDLPEGVTTIGNRAFSGCIALTSIDLPETLTSIGNFAFSSSKALTSITLPAGVTTIGEGAFYNCTDLTSIDLPEGLESIGMAAFNYCTSLTSIDLPEGVTSIGEYAFAGCTALKSIDLPDGLESIENNAFAGCNSLTSIDLPAGVTSIVEYAFNYCTSLTTVTCLATKVPNLGDNAFNFCSKLANIYVPAGSVDDYKAAANWSAYENIIQAIQ